MEISSLDANVGLENIQLATRISRDLESQSTNSVAGNCRIIGNATRIPWDHGGNVVSWQTEVLVYKLCGGLLIPLFFVLGVPANVVNMAVFYKQGLRERINVCLFLLSLVDLLHLAPVFIFEAEMLHSWFSDTVRNGHVYLYMLNNNLLGFFGFRYGTMLLSAVISTERCVCVLFPLAAQRCLPTKAFAAVVVVSVCSVSLLHFVVTAQYWAACFHEERTGRRSWQYVRDEGYVSRHGVMLRFLEGVFFGLCVTVGCPGLVLVTTAITAVRLWQIIRWRRYTSSGVSSPKELGVAKMLVCLSVEFVVLSSPVIIVRVTQLFPAVIDPTYHVNLYRILINTSNVSFYLSSAVNIVVYYLTGTRYRQTLHALLGIRKAARKSDHSKQTGNMTLTAISYQSKRAN